MEHIDVEKGKLERGFVCFHFRDVMEDVRDEHATELSEDSHAQDYDIPCSPVPDVLLNLSDSDEVSAMDRSYVARYTIPL